MKLYICYANYGWDGASAPLAVFDEKKAAKDWCKSMKNENAKYYFEELILNNPDGWK